MIQILNIEKYSDREFFKHTIILVLLCYIPIFMFFNIDKNVDILPKYTILLLITLLVLPILGVTNWNTGKFNIMSRGIILFSIYYSTIPIGIIILNQIFWHSYFINYYFPWIAITILFLWIIIPALKAYSKQKGYYIIVHFFLFPVYYIGMKSSKKIGKTRDKNDIKLNTIIYLRNLALELKPNKTYGADTHIQIYMYLLFLEKIGAIKITKLKIHGLKNEKDRIKNFQKYDEIYNNLYGNNYDIDAEFEYAMRIQFKVLREITNNDIRELIKFDKKCQESSSKTTA